MVPDPSRCEAGDQPPNKVDEEMSATRKVNETEKQTKKCYYTRNYIQYNNRLTCIRKNSRK